MEQEVRYLKGWFLFTILALVGGMLGGAAVGGVLGFFLGMVRVDVENIGKICSGVGLVLGFFVSFYFYRWSIKKYIFPQLS